MNAIVRHLPDFSPKKPKKVTDTFFRAVTPEGEAAPPKPAEPELDIAEITRAAEARGRAAGEAAARAVAQQEAEAAEQRYAERLAAARAEWSEAEAERLAIALAEGLAQMETRLAGAIAPILLPFLRVEIARQALDDLAALMGPMLAREDRPVLKIAGPADLLERLKARLGDPPACVFEAGPGVDVCVVAGETVLETQIKAWAERLGQSEA